MTGAAIWRSGPLPPHPWRLCPAAPCRRHLRRLQSQLAWACPIHFCSICSGMSLTAALIPNHVAAPLDCAVARRGAEIVPSVEHRPHKGLNTRAENFYRPTRRRERVMKRFKSPTQMHRFVSTHGTTANLFNLPRHEMTSTSLWEMRSLAMQT